MAASIDGPASGLFTPLDLQGVREVSDIGRNAAELGISDRMREALVQAPTGECVAWGIPFRVTGAVVVAREPVRVPLHGLTARWLVFLHCADLKALEPDAQGFISPMRGEGSLGVHAATYTFRGSGGSEAGVRILGRHQVGAFARRWGENCFQAVPHRKPRPYRAFHEQLEPGWNWGASQTRVSAVESAKWLDWLWAWENPRPQEPLEEMVLEPAHIPVLLWGVAAGNVTTNPLRWERRRKALVRLPEGVAFDPTLDDRGLLKQVQLDLGQVISAQPRPTYPSDGWERSYNNQLPALCGQQVLLEYTAHPEASFHLAGVRVIPIPGASGAEGPPPAGITEVPAATRRVRIRILDAAGGKPVPVKLHVHGEAGEYLAPIDRHRIPNTAWFEDYSTDFVHAGAHRSTYISGETTIDLPMGKLFLEISKGFEIRPLRRVFQVQADTSELTVVLERVLPWRERGWVTADTHVHFLSPMTALLEGEAEGVNIVNLLASQWGELVTNVADFDGRTTWGSREAGGSGEYLVRVGTENRQHVLGHISLLGYEGSIIAPMTTGGPDESALGDPVEVLLTEWAEQCRKQKGLVILPHFPNPRAEHAAAVIYGKAECAGAWPLTRSRSPA